MLARRMLLARGGSALVARLAGFYNGKVGSAAQETYFASSVDGGRTFVIGNGGSPVFVVAPATWYSDDIAQGSPVAEGASYVMYLSGFDGSDWRIGRWYSSFLDDDPAHWIYDTASPIIDLGSAGQPDDAGANFPQCEYDVATGMTRIWYTGWHGGKTTICYAERSSGGVITKYGRMLDVGAGSAFDEMGLETGPRITIGGQKRIYYDGLNAAGHYTCAYATYTDPRDAATYTKEGALASLTGPLTVSDGSFNSVHLESLEAQSTGWYAGFLSLFHPVGSANQREISAYAQSPDGITFGTPVGPIVPLTTVFPATESAENPAVLAA